MTGDQAASAAVGGAAAAASGWMSTVGNVAVQLVGVPLPVVIAALAGALLARVYLPPLPFGAALLRAFLWLLVGCIGSQGVAEIITVTASISVPVGLLGGLAMLVSGLGPKLWPVLVEQAPLMLKHWLAKFGGRDEGKSN
jgi:hypothetical protein